MTTFPTSDTSHAWSAQTTHVSAWPRTHLGHPHPSQARSLAASTYKPRKHSKSPTCHRGYSSGTSRRKWCRAHSITGGGGGPGRLGHTAPQHQGASADLRALQTRLVIWVESPLPHTMGGIMSLLEWNSVSSTPSSPWRWTSQTLIVAWSSW